MIEIFCVEDDKTFAKVLEHKLSLNPEYKVTKFFTGQSLLEHLDAGPSLITLDYHLPDYNGIALVEKIREHGCTAKVVALSGERDVKIASKLFKLGVYDYIEKDLNAMEQIWHAVHKALAHTQLEQEVTKLRDEIDQKYNFNFDLTASSQAMQDVFKLVEKTFHTNINVNLFGSTGTGKEMIAKMIHHNSLQKRKPFVAVNVSAIPDNLIESEFFGYEKGAFTGANTQRIGLLESVDGGTLFLDEIAEMSMTMQTKLLRVLQEQQIIRLGSNKKIPISFRLITATHKNILNLVRSGAFREDLYYRIVGIQIEIPPLRERGKDIILLANYFIQQFAKVNNIKPKKLSTQAIKILYNYHFPGNVRELRAMMEIAVITSDSETIEPEHITRRVQPPTSNYMKGKTLEQYTHEIIQQSLINNNYNISNTAKELNIGKSSIYNLINSGKIKRQ